MKVDIAHEERTKGLVFKKTLYGVRCSVTFSEEEQQIINQRKLKKRIVMRRPLSADLDEEKYAGREDLFFLDIGDLMKRSDIYYLTAPSDAKEYEADLIGQLQELKAFLDGNAEVAESKSFEL